VLMLRFEIPFPEDTWKKACVAKRVLITHNSVCKKE
jgi:hypothetical protein